MKNSKKEKIIVALKKANTSLNKILKGIEDADEKQCFDLMQQNLAIIGLLKSVNVLMLESHLNSQIDQIKIKSGSEKIKMERIRDEVIRIIKTAQNK